MIRVLALAVVGLAVTTPAAAVTYSFATNEPFAGGLIAFTYEAPDFVTTTGFVDAALFASRTPGLQRVRFDPGCTLGGGNCAQLSAFVETGFGTTEAVRYFTAGAFAAEGNYSAAFGSAATLGIAAVAVPEPATWVLLVIGFGAVGIGLRRAGRPVSACS